MTIGVSIECPVNPAKFTFSNSVIPDLVVPGTDLDSTVLIPRLADENGGGAGTAVAPSSGGELPSGNTLSNSDKHAIRQEVLRGILAH